MVVGQVRRPPDENAVFWDGRRREVPRYPRSISKLEVLWTNKKTCQQQVTTWARALPFYLISLRTTRPICCNQLDATLLCL